MTITVTQTQLCNVLTCANILSIVSGQRRSSSSYCYDFDTTLHVAELLPDLPPRVPPPRQDPVPAAEPQPGVQTRQQGLPQHQHDQPAEGSYAAAKYTDMLNCYCLHKKSLASSHDIIFLNYESFWSSWTDFMCF